MRGNGGFIGAPNIPTAALGPGTWGCNDVARHLRGRALGPGPLWPSIAADADFANVAFLAHCDEPSVAYLKDYSTYGADAARRDTAGGAINGSKNTGTKFGAYCAASTSNSAGLCYYTRLGTSLGTGDFTIEGWIYPDTTGQNMELVDLRPSDSVIAGPFIVIKTTNVLAYLKTGAIYDATGATTVSLNTWHHWHLTRISGVCYLGLDGAQEGSDVADVTNYTSQDLWIGCQVTANAGMVRGRFQEIRVSKVARYARTYTIPTAPFPDHA